MKGFLRMTAVVVATITCISVASAKSPKVIGTYKNDETTIKLLEGGDVVSSNGLEEGSYTIEGGKYYKVFYTGNQKYFDKHGLEDNMTLDFIVGDDVYCIVSASGWGYDDIIIDADEGTISLVYTDENGNNVVLSDENAWSVSYPSGTFPISDLDICEGARYLGKVKWKK